MCSLKKRINSTRLSSRHKTPHAVGRCSDTLPFCWRCRRLNVRPADDRIRSAVETRRPSRRNKTRWLIALSVAVVVDGVEFRRYSREFTWFQCACHQLRRAGWWVRKRRQWFVDAPHVMSRSDVLSRSVTDRLGRRLYYHAKPCGWCGNMYRLTQRTHLLLRCSSFTSLNNKLQKP